MKFADYLSKEQKQQLNQIAARSKPRKNKPKRKKEERVNWDEIMGTKNRGLRRKKGGAWTN